MIDFSRQLEDVVAEYPLLVLTSDEKGYLLNGRIELNSEYNGIPLYDEYEVEILIPYDFPNTIPIVTEKKGKVPKLLQHFMDDGSLCLGATCELYDYLQENKTILEFINDIVLSYLYTCSYFIRYGTVPYGERSHGIKGIIETFMERYNVSTEIEMIPILLYVAGIVKYRGHELCPCDSGRKFRNCHGKKVLQDINSYAYPEYKKEAILILCDWYNRNKGEENGNEYTAKE